MTASRADAIARFAADWQRSLRDDRLEPPRIADYVPDGAQTRLAILTELLRIDLRERWGRAADLGKRIAEYRKEFPEVEHSPDLADLVCAEFTARRRHAPLPVAEFIAEYPEFADELRERLAAFDTDEGTADFGAAESAAAVAALAELAPGRRIDDFDLLTDLGTGVLGRVFLARQRSMQRLVAVRLSAGRASAPQTMAQLDHPHIVRVFDQRLLHTDATAGMVEGGWETTGFGFRSDTVAPDPDATGTVTTPWQEPDDSFVAHPQRTAPAHENTVARPTGLDDITIAGRPDLGDSAIATRDERIIPTRPDLDDHTTAAPPDLADDTVTTADREQTGAAAHGSMGSVRTRATAAAGPDRHWAEFPLPTRTESAPLPGSSAVRARPGRVHSMLGAAAPRLVYMQYLPGGTALGVLAQRRRGPESDGGALLLRAVDGAMEAKGEIRPSDSSVRAEIAALSWPETVAWVGRRLADALDHAAHLGVLHHDIKPANVLFTAEGVPKLADFALRESGSAADATNHAELDADSLRYRSPEQLARLLDPAAPAPGTRSDLYSLGLLLWEMLTGAHPFDDRPQAAEARPDALARMLEARRAGLPDSALAQLPADTPAALRRVLLDCLRAEPKRRWRNGAELAGQLDLCLDARARDLADPPPTSLRFRARGWLIPVAALCVGVPNVLASWYNIQLNQSLIIDRLAAADQEKFFAVGLINNLISFPLAAVLLIVLSRRPLTVSFRLARGREYSARTLAKARRDTLLLGDWAVLVPFAMWVIAGVAWPLALAASGVSLPPGTFLHFFAAQLVCAAIALAYPFFPAMLFAVRVVYPQLLVRGGVGPGDERQLRNLARRGNFYLGVAASVPLLGVAGATFVDAADLGLVIVPVRLLSVGGILAFVVTYRLFRWLEADLLALARAIPQRRR
ncbi:protein kinase domain-containing protein [Nocardia brasiliensis]|uniref:protein kinase domain-containing protein n=1 Tax=Nocardia brasiliensis TaxID=37326 RepID=UPI00313C5F9A